MSTKLHLAINCEGVVIGGLLSGGEVHDVSAAYELAGLFRGCKVVADRGYDSKKLRELLGLQDCEAVIPGRKLHKKEIIYDKSLYRKRNLIERIFGKMKENRRLALRFDKSDINFLSFIAIALIKINLC